jgi:hypothetical protein
MKRKLLVATILTLTCLAVRPPKAAAIFQFCSAPLCFGNPGRQCTCPGTVKIAMCGTWQLTCS